MNLKLRLLERKEASDSVNQSTESGTLLDCRREFSQADRLSIGDQRQDSGLPQDTPDAAIEAALHGRFSTLPALRGRVAARRRRLADKASQGDGSGDGSGD